MSDCANPDDDAPIYVITGLGDAQHAIIAIRGHGAIIADIREMDKATRGRVSDMLHGAAIANGNSPIRLADGVYFLTTGRFPHPAEFQRYRDEPR
jgi:hypothetical protein